MPGDENNAPSGQSQKRPAGPNSKPKKQQTKGAALNALKKLLPPFQLIGDVVFIDSDEEDVRVANMLKKKREPIGIDFEWQPDQKKGSNNPFSLAQVATPTTVYIWLLFLWEDMNPAGLTHLLRSTAVLKVGCGLVGNDLRKLKHFGWLDSARGFSLPKGFFDIQSLKNDGVAPRWRSLTGLTAVFCRQSLPDPKFSMRTVFWEDVEDNINLRTYAAMDAQAALQVYLHAKQQEATRKVETLEPQRQATFSGEVEYKLMYNAFMRVEEDEKKTICETTEHEVVFERTGLMFEGNPVVRLHLQGDSVGIIFHSTSDLCLIGTGPNGGNKVLTNFKVAFFEQEQEHRVLSGLPPSIKMNTPYVMKEVYSDLAYTRMSYALHNWSRGLTSTLHKIILGDKTPIPATHHTPDIAFADRIADHQLNTSQQGAVKFAVERPFSLVHGPPGTGKTHTLAAIALYLHSHEYLPATPTEPACGRILVCAPSNEATENIALMILKSAGTRLSPGQLVVVQSSSRQYMVKKPGLSPYIGYSSDKSSGERIANASIICSTLMTSGHWALQTQKFATVLVDEGSQCVETETLLAIAHGAQRLVIAGDHKQLRPVVMATDLKSTSFAVSMFERLMQCQEANSTLLSIQYRMHPNISAWPNATFYDNRLQNAPSTAKHVLPPNVLNTLGFGLNALSNIFIHIQGATVKTRRGSAYNKSEADLALAIRNRFVMRAHYASNDVVVLSPYTGQVGQLRNNASAYTITQFQGREAPVVIVSLARSVKTAVEEGVSGLGFVAEPQRINVALTRAKYAQIVIGDACLLQTDPLWSSALENYDKTGCLFRLNSNPAEAKLEHVNLTDIPKYVAPTPEQIQAARATVVAAKAAAQANGTAAASSSAPAQPKQNKPGKPAPKPKPKSK